MLPRLRKLLTKPSRTRTNAEAVNSNEVPDEGSQNLSEQGNDSFLEDPYRSGTGSVEENISNQELHFIVDYLGYCQVSEVQSISLLLESVKRVKKGCAEPSRVDFVIKEGVLKVSTVGCHALILTVPLYIVALCAQESLRGFDKCFGLNITRKNAHLCYVFQAGSSLEASSIVRSVALSFKSLGKMLREKKEKMRLMRRTKKTPLYHQNSLESDWSSQTGYYNDSVTDPWQKFEVWSRMSSTTSKGTGSEQLRSSMAYRLALNQATSKRPHTHHSFKHVEFTALSPVPSHSGSNNENSVNVINISSYKAHDRIPENLNAVKRKGEFQIEVDIHRDVNQRLGKIERQDNSVLQESCLEFSRDESACMLQNEDHNICMCEKDNVTDERIEMVLSAIQRGDVACLASYLDDGVDVDLADSTRRSLLFHAVNYGQIAAVQLLLDRGATVNWEGPNDMSPLHQAAANRHKSIAQILLANGANVRAKDCEFRTPLHMCAGHPSGTEMSCILVEHGARICDNSIDGTRPLDQLPDLKELQSRLVQSVCEVFMAADTSKSHSNSVTSTHSCQSGYSVFSGGSVVAHVGSMRNVYNQSPQMRHARHVSRRLTANFDVGSFQWKKDAKSDYISDPTIQNPDRSCKVHDQENDIIPVDHTAPSNNLTNEEIKDTCNTIPTHNTSYESHDSQTRTTCFPAKIPLSVCETHGLHEKILAAHHRGTSLVIGSLDTWAEANASEALMSSTPADALLDETDRPPFAGGTMHPLPDLVNSADSGLQVHAKDETARSVCVHQSILHNSKTYPETMKGRTRGDSVRFQQFTSPIKETDSGLGVSEGSPLLSDAKELTDRFRERTRSNADSCYSSISPYCCKEDDPVLIALNSLVKLSFNPECQPLLLSYLCLPKASSLLSVFARSPTARQWVAEAVAILIKNLASIEGPDSRRRAAEAGFIRTVLQLAETPEPVQTTCLEVLDNLLKDVKCEREYNSTMTNIPSGPLLNLLHFQNDVDPVAYALIAETSDTSTSTGKKRKTSRSHQDVATKLSPRLVATRLLAASSTHLKMQKELGSPRAVSLILEALEERDAEIVHNAAVTIANIAMYDGNHSLLINSNAVESLKTFVPKDSRAYYHLCRTLVYLNCDDGECDYLFDFDTEEPRPLFTERSANQESYIKGGSLESLVRILTTRAVTLWGGVPLLSPSPKNRSRVKLAKRKSRANEDQVIEFFLATYSTYTNAVVLLRLLVHRFRDPALMSLFDEETGVFKDHTRCLPSVHISLMRILVTWLEKFPQDFRENSTLQVELNNLINSLASYQGPYLVCAQHLEDLFVHYQENMPISLPPENHCHHDILFRSCQQAVLSGALPAKMDDAIYLAALQLYIELSSLGDQPSAKVFVTDAGLEKISTSRIKLCLNPTFHKVKNVYKRVRAYNEQIAREAPSQRKAKHDFIDCCQGMPAYGCKFFRVKEICSNKSHLNKRLLGISAKDVVLLESKTRSVVKKWDLKSLLGWKVDESNGSLCLLFSESSFLFVCESGTARERLQDSIKQCVYERNCEGLNEKDFRPWTKRSEEKRNWGKKAMEDEINHRLENLSKSTKIFESHDEWKSLSLLYMRSGKEESRHRRHSSPSHRNAAKHSANITPMVYSNTIVAADHESDSLEDDVYAPMMAYSVGTLDQRNGEPSHLSEPQTPNSMQKSSMTTQSTFGQQLFLENNTNYLNNFGDQNNRDHDKIDDVMSSSKLKICLCPPDAELSGFHRNAFTVLELLHFPRELARQITLIDHDLFRNITTADILKRVSEGANKRRKKGEEDFERTTVELFSDRFNQLSSWVVASLIKENSDQNTADMIVQFIETAKQCLELRNYNAVMAIGVGALCSAPVRRIRKAIPDLIPKRYLDQLHIMEVLMDSRENHKKYRESLKSCPSPAVPYFGVYLKDLIYISEGNPDYLNGGMINLGKRRLLYAVLHQIRRFQVKSYNFEQVPEIQEYLLNTERYTDEELHRMSRKLDTSSRHTISEGSHEATMSVSGVSMV